MTDATGARAEQARALAPLAGEAAGRRWDEPPGCTSPRGWLRAGETCTGFYLDYGPDHYRSPHEYCQPGRLCRECQPGNVLAARYPAGPGLDGPRDSRYFETVAAARGWVETGGDQGADAHFPARTSRTARQ